ncbi:hypothetical protein G7Y89_g3386 [Cudoniella acicularis]|uniref:Uncharacterized protein n=1 Tax=Cudoniella acicularis TaxID=354080 RepID=A0A8H4RTC1_9HELO|nr:hypothetical protein G7Y89_g3386 [Cudoniella acicularis]
MIQSTIEIATPPDRLLDFPNIPNWHTGFITSIRSETPEKPLEKDDAISGNMGGMNFKAKILECTSEILSWTGPPVLGLFRGIHVFRFEPSKKTDGGTTFTQEESFKGILAWVFSPYLPLGWLTKRHFDKFGAELKVEAERNG